MLDLRLLKHVNQEKVMTYAGAIDADTVRHNLSALLQPAGHRLWERNYHYVLVRKAYTLEQIVENVKTAILKTV